MAITANQFRDSVEIYRDGSLVTAIDNGINANADLATTFYLGSRSDLLSNNAANFQGMLDDVRIYSRVLSGADISELTGPPGISAIGTVNILEDSSANNLPFMVNDLQTSTPFLVVTTSSSNPTLLPNGAIVLSGTGPNRTATLTPMPNAVGASTVSLVVTDGNSLTDTQSFVLNVAPVNDAPTFTAGAHQSVLEDAGPQSIPNWAGAIDDGDPEVTQTTNFVVTPLSGTVNFSVFPTVSPTGTLSYTSAPDSVGSATFSVRLDDNGGTANGGVNQSADQTFTVSVGPVNDAPTVNAISNLSTNEDTATVAIAITLGDVDNPVAGLTLSATSSNSSLVPVGNVVFGGAGASRTAVVTPDPDQFGTASITVTVSDGADTSASTFILTVNPVNDAPTIAPFADIFTIEDTASGSSAIAVGDIDSSVLGLSLTATSSNLALAPLANIVFGGSGASRTVTITPAPDQSGTASITMTVSDGFASSARTFILNVIANNDPPSFAVGANQSLLFATNTAQSISNWATAITDGDPDFAQNLTFNVSNDRNSMFSVQPTVAANGTLSFTPNGTAGLAIVSVILTDDASAGGPAVSTPPQTFSIIVRGVPDVSIEQRSPAATVVGEPFSVRVRVRNPSSTFQPSGNITVVPLPIGEPVQCSLVPIATPSGAAEATCTNLTSPIASAKLIQAIYNGDIVFDGGEGISPHPVEKAATRLTILEDLPDPSMSNSPVAVRYLLEVLPPSLSLVQSLTGVITLSDGQSEFSAPFSPSNPVTSITLQGNGARVLTARYGSDANFLDSSDTEDHQLIGGNNTDLAVTISNYRRFVSAGRETIYDVRVSNLGSISSSAQLDAFVPTGLDNYRWTCSASVGSSCHAPSGVGTIIAGINILPGGQVTYTIRADVIAAEATQVRNSVSITPSVSPPDSNPANDVAVDSDVVVLFLDGFED